MRRVAIVGAGWSGLACALELSALGVAVEVLDAAPQAGGRARAVTLTLGDRQYRLDNGQHLLVGACRETLRLMAAVGVDIEAALLRRPFELRYPDGFLLRAAPLPAPLHLAAALLLARKLPWDARRQALRWVRHWECRRWRIAEDAPATTLFTGAPAILTRRLWRPLCVAALNVEPEEASARTLLNVLRDSLAGGRRAADLLIPRFDLSRLFVDPAVAELQRRGVAVHLRQTVCRLNFAADRWQIDRRGQQRSTADAVVLALPPRRAAQLLASADRPQLDDAIALLRRVPTAPIVTVYLRYPSHQRLPWPAITLLDDPAAGRFGQWVFDRGQLDPGQAGVLSVVVSAATSALERDHRSLAGAVAAQLSADLGLPPPMASAVLAEKSATVAPSPGLARPATRLPLQGLFLAGDASDADYPSTLEGSVRAGVNAAKAVADDLRRT